MHRDPRNRARLGLLPHISGRFRDAIGFQQAGSGARRENDTLTGIGMGLGRIGRVARQADACEHPAVANPSAPMAVPVVPPLAERRHRDFGDVVELIRYNHLDESFMEQLDRSVHSDFVECLEEKRREVVFGQARSHSLEIDQVGLAIANDDVLRLKISMNEEPRPIRQLFRDLA